jgi:hypothetical protein
MGAGSASGGSGLTPSSSYSESSNFFPSSSPTAGNQPSSFGEMILFVRKVLLFRVKTKNVRTQEAGRSRSVQKHVLQGLDPTCL